MENREPGEIVRNGDLKLNGGESIPFTYVKVKDPFSNESIRAFIELGVVPNADHILGEKWDVDPRDVTVVIGQYTQHQGLPVWVISINTPRASAAFAFDAKQRGCGEISQVVLNKPVPLNKEMSTAATTT